MITKEQLQAMSDFDVNKALAVMLWFRLDNSQDGSTPEVLVIRRTCDSLISTAVDYCNIPNDIMPLAFEHGVSFFHNVDSWIAMKSMLSVASPSYKDTNPLRAIACCLILVLQGKVK